MKEQDRFVFDRLGRLRPSQPARQMRRLRCNQSWYESSHDFCERLLDLGPGLARQAPQLFWENDAFELIPLQEP
jgi:hypothetical protein